MVLFLFRIDRYNRSRYVSALKVMVADGYNVNRVFIDDARPAGTGEHFPLPHFASDLERTSIERTWIERTWIERTWIERTSM